MCILYRQLTWSIASLHTSLAPLQIVHGDIKPENILVTSENEVVLIDFGSSEIRTPDLELASSHVPFFGSLSYTPPECLGSRVGLQQSASDVWGLGLTTLELLLGWTPYQLAEEHCGMGVNDELLTLVTDPLFLSILLDLAEARSLLPPMATDFVRQALDPNPMTR